MTLEVLWPSEHDWLLLDRALIWFQTNVRRTFQGTLIFMLKYKVDQDKLFFFNILGTISK